MAHPPKETLVLSDYDPRQDMLVNPAQPIMRKIFEGTGEASTWHIEIPRSINDIDYGAIIDVTMTISYQARSGPALHDSVLAAIAKRAGVNARQRGIPLRWIYPDAFFSFQRTGSLSFTLFQRDFPSNQLAPVVSDVAIVVTPTGGLARSGLKVELATPPRSRGRRMPTGPSSRVPPAAYERRLAIGTALGAWTLSVTAADNPTLVQAGTLNLSGIANIALVLGYTFTPRS